MNYYFKRNMKIIRNTRFLFLSLCLSVVALLNTACSIGEEISDLGAKVVGGQIVMGGNPVLTEVSNEQKEVNVALNNHNILRPVDASSSDPEAKQKVELDLPYQDQISNPEVNSDSDSTINAILQDLNIESSSSKAQFRADLVKLNKQLLSRLKFDQQGNETTTKIPKQKLTLLMDNYAINVDKYATEEQLNNLAKYVNGALKNKIEFQNKLADFYLDGLHGESFEELSVSWYLLSAINNSPYAQYMLSIFYKQGLGVAQSLTDSVLWYQKASNHKFGAVAKLQVAKRYLLPYSLIHDEQQAALWMEQAALEGVTEAQYLLADMYLQGRGVAKSDLDALNWYGKAAAKGSAYAQYSLGVMYYNGQGVAQNLQEANKWLTYAAFQGHNEAQYLLGRMYQQGFGVHKSLAQAYAWWQMIPRSNIVADDFDGKVRSVISAMTAKELIEAKELNREYRKKIKAS